MKLFEMTQRPQKAGAALLQFRRGASPKREGDTIILPDDPELEFFSLKDGQQFLLRVYEAMFAGGRVTGCWFGGTEHQPFVVKITDVAFAAFRIDGEDGFFDYLKPAAVKQCEELFTVKTKRQGDLFAVPIPYSWDQLNQALALCHGTGLGTDGQPPKDVTDSPLINTRHKLTGRRVFARVFGNNSTIIGTGIITAPDHPTLELGQQLHLIVQANGLA